MLWKCQTAKSGKFCSARRKWISKIFKRCICNNDNLNKKRNSKYLSFAKCKYLQCLEKNNNKFHWSCYYCIINNRSEIFFQPVNIIFKLNESRARLSCWCRKQQNKDMKMNMILNVVQCYHSIARSRHKNRKLNGILIPYFKAVQIALLCSLPSLSLSLEHFPMLCFHFIVFLAHFYNIEKQIW